MTLTTKRALSGTAIALVMALSGQAIAAEQKVVSVEFTATPAPANDADMVRSYTKSTAIVTYADGKKAEFPLSYNVLFQNTDKLGKAEAGRLFDVDGKPLVDRNGDPVIAETPDANSLLRVGAKTFLVNHWEYDWMLGNGQEARKAENWYSRMPMSMSLTEVSLDKKTGMMKAVSQRPIDFASVQGLWIPCFGSQTPWNTHLGSEEDYDLYFLPADGKKYKKTTEGLKALTEVYFNGKKQANPYDYGYLVEVKVNEDGSNDVTKHYAAGRGTWEMGKVMADGRTVYKGDDGDHVFLSMFVADKEGDLSSGTNYAARWVQKSAENGGSAALEWVNLGHITNAEVKAMIDKGVTADDIFEFTDAATNADWKKQGFTAIQAGSSAIEYVKLKPGMEKAAVAFETRRLAALKGASTDFNKMEGVAVNAKDKVVYIAMSYVEKGMTAEEGAPADHIKVNKIKAGATYAIQTKGGLKDTDGKAINSDWVGTFMDVPAALVGEDIKVDALGNIAHPDKVANPDNVFFSEKMRTLFIGEDSGTHVNNFVWAYNVDTKTLTRIMSVASGGESTGLQVVENMDGHAYVMSNAQHQGEWLKSMPKDVKDRLIAEATKMYGVNGKGVPNYYLSAPVGYMGGIPGL